MPRGIPKEKETDPKVDKLEQMMTDLVGVVSKLSDKVDSMNNKTEWIKPQVKVEENRDEQVQDVVIPPKWRQIVDEILGKDFGLSVEYPDSGKGFSFTILVPREKSNAPDAHWDFYRCDKRTKAIGNAEGIEGVRRYCELIKRNLTRPKP